MEAIVLFFFFIMPFNRYWTS